MTLEHADAAQFLLCELMYLPISWSLDTTVGIDTAPRRWSQPPCS
jgi:hypothetical protein